MRACVAASSPYFAYRGRTARAGELQDAQCIVFVARYGRETMRSARDCIVHQQIDILAKRFLFVRDRRRLQLGAGGRAAEVEDDRDRGLVFAARRRAVSARSQRFRQHVTRTDLENRVRLLERQLQYRARELLCFGERRGAGSARDEKVRERDPRLRASNRLQVLLVLERLAAKRDGTVVLFRRRMIECQLVLRARLHVGRGSALQRFAMHGQRLLGAALESRESPDDGEAVDQTRRHRSQSAAASGFP